MKLSRAARIPGWWQTMTGLPTTKLLDLLAEVEHQGASPNDRTVVERIWRQWQLARLFAARNAAAPPTEPPEGGTAP